MLRTLAERAYLGTLKTNASWWVLHGGTMRGFWIWVVANKTLAFFLAAIGVIAAVVALLLALHQPTHA